MLRLQRIVGALLVLGLLVGSGVAFAVAQSLKSEPPRVVSADFTQAKAFSPGCDCDAAIARFSLALSRAADLSVRVTTRRGRLVRTLLDHERREGVVALTWDGRDGTGTPGDRPQLPGAGALRPRPVARGAQRRDPRRHEAADHHGRPAHRPDHRVRRRRRRRPVPLHRGQQRGRERVADGLLACSADGTVDEVWRPDEPVALAPGKATELSWPAANRTAARPADDGTYLVGYEVRDAAGNIVRTPPEFTPGETGTRGRVRVQALEITPSRADR